MTRTPGAAPRRSPGAGTGSGGVPPEDAATADAPAVPAGPVERATPVRLARLHLRMGSLPLARAELESLAGRSMLDEDAMLDLAEVRWRTGDLAGAGEAANAVIARGRTDALAFVIAAESVAAHGRPGEARRLAARALEAADGPIDPLFAGIPKNSIWPEETTPEAIAATPADPGEPIAAPDARARRGRAGAASVAGSTAIAHADEPAPATTGAAEAYAGGRAALGAGDADLAAVRLGVALRLEPGYAKDVLDAIEDREEPALELVMGDALRLLGRESEALTAYDRARGGPRAASAAHPDAVEDIADGDDDPA